LPRRNLLHNLVSKKHTAQEQANQNGVDNGGHYNAIGAVIVILTPNFFRRPIGPPQWPRLRPRGARIPGPA